MSETDHFRSGFVVVPFESVFLASGGENVLYKVE